MRKVQTAIAILMLCAVGLFAAADALGQPGMGRGAGPRRRGARIYDPKTVETISGDVISVEKVARGKGPFGGGIHLTVKTDKEQIAIHLGPSWYMDKQALKIQAKDHVEVRGSRVMINGQPAIIAAEVKKGNQSLKLRDDDGLPMWRGQGRRRAN